MIFDINKKTVDISADLQEIDDEMGDKVTREGLIKRYFLEYLKHDIEVGFQYPLFISELRYKGNEALDISGYYDAIEEDFIENELKQMYHYLERLFKDIQIIDKS